MVEPDSDKEKIGCEKGKRGNFVAKAEDIHGSAVGVEFFGFCVKNCGVGDTDSGVGSEFSEKIRKSVAAKGNVIVGDEDVFAFGVFETKIDCFGKI